MQHELTMKPLPAIGTFGRNSTQSTHISWDQAVGNVEDALVSVQALRSLVDDAVYLDESAYTGAANLATYTAKIQGQARRIHELELEVAAVQAEAAAKDRALASAAMRHRDLQQKIKDMQEELDNSSVVFKMHYQELITRTEEIDRLNTLVSQLQQQVQQQAHFPPQPSASEAAISEAATTHGLRPSHSHEHEQQHNQEQQQTPHSLNDASEKSVMW